MIFLNSRIVISPFLLILDASRHENTLGDIADDRISGKSPHYHSCGDFLWDMIDAGYQGRGYGKAALKESLAYIAGKPFGESDRIVLTCGKENAAVLALYRMFGFAETGNFDDDEIELALNLDS